MSIVASFTLVSPNKLQITIEAKGKDAGIVGRLQVKLGKEQFVSQNDIARSQVGKVLTLSQAITTGKETRS